MEKGVVKWFSDRRGYGFITREDGSDVFVHHSGIESEGFRTLYEGDKVEFETENSDKGPRAVSVKRI
jgi:CspA family cold shock protein